MGYIDETSAKIVLRHPYHDGIRLDYRAAYDTDPLGSDTAFGNAWKGAGVIFTTPESDYTATFDLKQLHPDTKYQYRTNVGHAGSFTTMVSNPDKFTLISSSCIKPGFPYSPFQHSLSIHGLSHLSRYLERTKIDMMLFLGDFIYIDLPKRFGYSVEDYQTAYRQVYASPDWTDALRALPWVHAYDDHEITNNWDGNQSGIYQEAITPFLNYQHNGNPAPVQQESTYYTFSRGQVSFFVLDTRRHRSPGANIDGPDKTMLGREQLASVMRWLKTAPGWKVLLSSVPFTRNFQATDEEDYWAGYLYERQEILNAMWQTDGVLIITGDRHEHATTAFPPPGASNTTVIEFSTSPLSQFVNPFVKSYKQVAGTDVAINYHHEGRSKFGSFTFDTSDPYTWKMDYELIVDGASVWNYTVIQDRKQS